jgi:hypothetical protein
MRPAHRLAALALLLIVSCPAAGSAQESPPWQRWDGERYVAHEWGTFTGVLGSNGAVLDGLLHEERDLPAFVLDLRDAFGLTARAPKMETPVIYFYAPQPWRIAVDVRFPRGVITQWYPAASAVNFQDAAPGERIDELRDGFVTWGGTHELLVVAPDEEVELAPVAADDPWAFQREVAANGLRVCGVRDPAEPEARYGTTRQFERMLFYRGLGDFPLPLAGEVFREESADGRATVELALENLEPAEPLTGMFLVLVDEQGAGFTRLPDLTTRYHVGPLHIPLAPTAVTSAALAAAVSEELVAAGLYLDEARAMVRTWEHGWFGDPGLRVLYVLPPAFVDRELPLTITPHTTWDGPLGAPRQHPSADEVTRVFVGRTDLLSPGRERDLVRAVRSWADGEGAERAAARAEILRWGRFAAPYLERVAELTGDAAVAGRARAELAELELRR